MKPYYLKFQDEAEAIAKLQEAGLENDPGLDLIGESYRNDAVYDGMTLVSPPTKRDGWFVNWLGEELPEVLVPFARTPDPATPFRVFAGWGPDEVSAVK